MSLYPSPSFLPRISWPKRVQTVWPQGYNSPGPPKLDRSLKSDRSLCPVRALRYYLNRTSSRIRRWFLSPLRKVLTKTSYLPLSPLGSSRLWSYVMSSLTREAHTLHQVKAHDVRAFDASKVFQSEVSLDTVLSACHWSHIIPSHGSIWRAGLGLTQSFTNWAR